MENQINETTQQTSSNNEINQQLIERFKNERKEWTDRIKEMSERLRDIYKVADLQVDLYSNRQIAVEYCHTLQVHLTKVIHIFRARKIDRWEHYTRNYDLRMDKDPKELHIFVDIADINERKELLQNHLEFFRETIKTIDTISFGIKHRIQLEEYRRG
jgi:acetolactate synthase small subunit